jgi:hypothetical protein
MSAITIAGDTSGSITLDAPAVAGTTTLTLPATSGTVAMVSGDLGTPSALVGTNITGTANALNAGIGVNQTWQSVSRAIGTTYTNSTGKPIVVAITYTNSLGNSVQGLVINGATVYASGCQTATFGSGFSLVIPNGATYVTVSNSGTMTLVTWMELR